MLLRLWLLSAVFALLAAGFIGRLFQLQLVEGQRHVREVERSTLVRVHLPPQRGRILDRSGTPLADSRPAYHLAVVLSELELLGKERSAPALWRLDGPAFDAFLSDLAGRVRWTDPQHDLRSVVERLLDAAPGVAIRGGSQRPGGLALLAVPRETFARIAAEVVTAESDTVDASPASRLAESDLLADDPADALARELTLVWGEPVLAFSEPRWVALTAALDAAGNGERLSAALEPFVLTGSIPIPMPGSAVGEQLLPVRLLTAERRRQAELLLSRLAATDVADASHLFTEAMRALPQARPGAWTYAAGAEGERVAALLPSGPAARTLPVPALSGQRERILIIQGDPPLEPGLGAVLMRRLSDSTGADPRLVEGLLVRHGRKVTVAACEHEFKIRLLLLDPARLGRLCAGAATLLTAAGRPVTSLDIEAAVAEVRHTVDRGWAGEGRGDAVVAIRALPHAVALALAGADAEPPDDLRRAYALAEPPLPGALLRIDVGRTWPLAGSASHVLGRVGRAESAEVGGEIMIGASGLERFYDGVLRGVAGVETRMRTAHGMQLMYPEPALPGADLVTEIDAELQLLTEDSLTNRLELAQAIGTRTAEMDAAAPVGANRAGFVLMDCHTGGLLVLASTPTLPVEDLGARITEVGQLEALRRQSVDPAERARLKLEIARLSLPLHDYACEGDQPPGSSFKILTGLCALEQGVLTPGERISCPGYMAMIGGKKVLRDHASGEFDLVEAVQVSSNVYFAKVAERLSRRLGPGYLPAWAERVGMGRMNSLDVDQQRPRWTGDLRAGLMPTPETLRSLRPKESAWLPSDTWRMGIGQFCTASPLQVVAIAAAVANGGRVVSPFLVRPRSQPVVIDLNIRQEWLAELRRGMEKVTQAGGTARTLVLDGPAAGLAVAAKTGTSEWGSPATREAGLTPDHAWMIGYAPADRPVVAFACFIHSGTFGGKACTPVVKRVLERYFAKYGRTGHAAAGW